MREEEKRVLAANRMRNIVRELKAEYGEFLYPLSKMECVEQTQSYVFGDGLQIFYYPGYVVGKENSKIKAELMHILFHGILGHLESDKAHIWDKGMWRNMDAQVMSTMEYFGIPSGENLRGRSHSQVDRYEYTAVRCNISRAEELIFSSNSFRRDRHEKWGGAPEEKRDRMSLMWRLARKCLVEARGDRVLDRGMRLYFMRTELGLAEKELEEILSGNEPENNNQQEIVQKLKKMDLIGQWRLVDYLCERIAADEEGKTYEYAEISRRLEKLLHILEVFDEQEVLQEKVFWFVNREELLLKAVSSMRTEGYLKLCRQFLKGMGESRYV